MPTGEVVDGAGNRGLTHLTLGNLGIKRARNK